METNETYQFSTCSKLWKFSNCSARQFSSKRLHIWVYHHNRGKTDSMVQMGFSRRLQKLNNVFVRLLCDFKLHKYATNRKIWQVNLFKREKNPIFFVSFVQCFCDSSVSLDAFVCILTAAVYTTKTVTEKNWKNKEHTEIKRERGKNGM